MRKREKIAAIKRFVKSGELHNAVELMNITFNCKVYIRKAPIMYFREHEYKRNN
jgi:hypothetical protein